MIVDLIVCRDLKAARDLVLGSGLSFEEPFDNIIGAFEEGRLVATAARKGNVLKMFAIAPEHQGGSLLGELVTELVRRGAEEGYGSFFVFTRPQTEASFQALNFRPLVRHPQAVLLEYGGGLERFLQLHRPLRRDGVNGAVVMNCNPFTLGHRYLIEAAARQVDCLYVFVVREDRSVFPFDIRLRLVREGTRDLRNILVLDSSDYCISAVTFPAYFLKATDDASAIQMEIDLQLFGARIAPFFGIRRRFIGTEPFCRTTRLYGESLRRILPGLGVEMQQMERLIVDGEVVSAFRVRNALRREAFETVRRLVPQTTLSFLLSEEAREIREKLKSYQQRH